MGSSASPLLSQLPYNLLSLVSRFVTSDVCSSCLLPLLQNAPKNVQCSCTSDIWGVAGNKWPSVLKMYLKHKGITVYVKNQKSSDTFMEVYLIQAQWLDTKALTCVAHFRQGYQDPQPNQKEAIDI